jgi:hypothetical protein
MKKGERTREDRKDSKEGKNHSFFEIEKQCKIQQ